MKHNRKDICHTQADPTDYFNYSEETGGFNVFTNSDLICRDCKYATNSLTTCLKFNAGKPNSAFYTGCTEYRNNDR